MKALISLLLIALTIVSRAQRLEIPLNQKPILYDVSGMHTGTDGFANFTADVVHHANGTLSGLVRAVYQNEGCDLAAEGPLSGRIADKLARFTFKGLMAGTNESAVTSSGLYALRVRGRFDEYWQDGWASDAVSAFNIPGIGHGRATNEFFLDSRNGGAIHAITFTNMVQTGKRLSGEATIVIGTRTYRYSARGYPVDGFHHVRLKGLGAGAGSRLIVNYGNETLLSIRGRLLGQVVKFELTSGPLY